MQIKLKIIALTALLLTLVCAVSISAQRTVNPGGNNSNNQNVQTTTGFADINGARIYYTITGTGEPLVLIHDYLLNGDLFVKQR